MSRTRSMVAIRPAISRITVNTKRAQVGKPLSALVRERASRTIATKFVASDHKPRRRPGAGSRRYRSTLASARAVSRRARSLRGGSLLATSSSWLATVIARHLRLPLAICSSSQPVMTIPAAPAIQFHMGAERRPVRRDR
jgi:hypothetical protein